MEYEGLASPLQQVWVALRASIREVLEAVTLADLVSGKLPKEVAAFARPPEAWVSH